MRKYYPLLTIFLIFTLLSTMTELRADRGITIENIEIESGERTLTGLYARPDGTHEADSLPGIAIFHGFTASKEMMRPFIEGIARVGIAVIAIDQQGHGLSSGRLGEDGNNSLRNDGVEVIQYLRNIEIVDSSLIAILGHSMGAGTAIATSTYLGDLQATILIGNSLEGIEDYGVTPTFPANVFMGIGRYDELFTVDNALDNFDELVSTSAEINTLYGDFSSGTARELKVTPTDHILEVLNPGLVERSIEWTYKSLVDENVNLEDDPLKSVNGWGYIFDQLISLLAGLSLLAVIPAMMVLNPQENSYSKLSTNWFSQGLISFVSFFMAIPVILISNRSYPLLFITWFFLGFVFFTMKRQTQVDTPYLKTVRDALFIRKDAFYAIGLLLLIMTIVQTILGVVHWDYRYVLPVLSALDIRRFGLFLLLFVTGVFFFAIEIAALQGKEIISIKQYSKDVLGRIWAFGLLLTLHYVPIVVFQTPILPTFIGFLAFFIVGLLPIMLILSVFSTWGRTKGWSPLAISILSIGVVAWILASTLSFNV